MDKKPGITRKMKVIDCGETLIQNFEDETQRHLEFMKDMSGRVDKLCATWHKIENNEKFKL